MHKIKSYIAWLFVLMTVASSQAMDLNLSWNPTSTSTDGTTIDNVNSYRLYYGENPGTYSNYVQVTGKTTVTVSGLEYNKGYYFAVKAYVNNIASAFSSELVWISPVMPDTDADGLSDNWELQYAPSLSQMQTDSDYDDDGVSDRDEFITGSDPRDPLDVPTVEIHATSPGITVSFDARAASGQGYENRVRYITLMHCEDLIEGNWTAVPGSSSIMASGQTESIVINPNQPSGFYRTNIELH